MNIYKDILPKRADIFVKYAYIEAYISKNNLKEATELYKKHIRLYAPKLESEKGNLDGYIQSFNRLIESFQKKGYEETSHILYTEDREEIYVFDGIHRLTCCLYFGFSPQFKKVQREEKPIWDIKWFQENNFSSGDINTLIFYWLLIDDSLLPFFLWNSVDTSALKNFEDTGIDVICEVPLEFSRKDFYEFVTDVYHFETDSDKLSAVDEKILELLKKGPSFTLLFCKTEKTYEELGDIKKNIRKNILSSQSLSEDKYYYTFHSPDSQKERDYLRELFYPQNMKLLSLRTAQFPKNFMNNFFLLRSLLHEKNIDYNTICVIKSGPMSIFGLHNSYDVDIIFENYNGNGVIKLEDGTDTVEVLDYQYHQTLPNREIIYERKNHFWFRGIKFLILPLLLEVKGYDGGCIKDFKHAGIIKKFLQEIENRKGGKYILRNFLVELRLLKRKIQLAALHVLGYISSKLGIYDQMFYIWTHYIKKRK